MDHNRVLSGERTFELVNFDWKFPYHIVHMNRRSGALVVPIGTYHRSISGEDGSIVINQAVRDEEFNPDTEFIPVSAGNNPELYRVLVHEQPVIHDIGENNLGQIQKAKAKSSKTTSTRQKNTAPGKPKAKTTTKAKKPSSTPVKKPSVRKTATKKPTFKRKELSIRRVTSIFSISF